MCDRCEELQERIYQLEHSLYARDVKIPAEFALNATQERILALLLRYDRAVDQDTIFEATRGMTRAIARVRGDKLVNTQVCKLRQRLAPWGLGIETVYGVGYRLPAHTRKRLLSWPDRKAA